MPSIKDLDRFQRELIALAREDEVLASWGETREVLPLPSVEAQPAKPAPRSSGIPRPPARPDLPPDFASLLAQVPQASTGAEPPPPQSSEGGMGAELEALLAMEPGSGDQDRGAAPPADEEPFSLEGLGLEDLGEGKSGAEEEPGFDLAAFAGEMQALEEEAAADFPGGAEAPPSGAAGFEPEPPVPGAFELEPEQLGAENYEAAPLTPASEEDFGLGDLDLASTWEPGGQEEGGAPLEEAFPDEMARPVETAAPDETAFPDEGDFGAPAAAEPEELPPEDFAIPDIGDLDFSEGGAPGSLGGEEAADPLAEPPFADMTPAEIPVEEGLGEPEEEAFDLPSFDLDDAAPEEGPPKRPPPAEESFGIPLHEEGGAPSAEGEELGGFDFGEGSLGGDAFDAFSFGEAPNPALAGDALDRELASLGSDSGQATFNLDGNWGGSGAFEEGGARPTPRPEPKSKEEKPARPLALSDAQVDRLQDSLLALPLNLRLAVEDLIANEKGSEAQRTDLIWMLVEGASTGDFATAAGRILRRRIAVPEGYVHRTGAGYLAEKGSLRYVLINTVLPILRTALLALLVAGALGFLGYRFVYRPLVATQIYREGYQRIQEGRYPEAEDAFDRATATREFLSWYYRYAEAYSAKRLWIYAENKYAQLLSRHPAEKRGALEWASIEREQLKYREGVDILNKYVLDRRNTDADALLLEGDIFLDWADEDPAKYEEARRRFASLIQFYGMKDPYLERMLLYFMRTDNLKEVLPLKDRFLGAARDPLAASTLGELGGFLLDHGEMTDDLKVLRAALAKDPALPETHWQLHRFYRKSGDRGDELKALGNAIAGFERLPALGKRRLSMYLDSLIRRGDLGIEDGQYLRADGDFGKAVVAYQRALDIGRLAPDPAYARAWAGLGDVAYLAKDDLAAAEDFYASAAARGWDNAEIRYRRGFVAYRQGRFADALEHFWTSKREGNSSPFLEWALGAGFAQRGDWSAAESSFKTLVDAMGDRFDALDYPLPQEKLYDRNVTELLMEAQNNLGVSLFRLGNRLGDPRLKAKSVAAFTESARLFDLIVHDARSLVGANAANLGYANLDYVLHPRRGVDLALYEGIQKDDGWIEP